MIIFLLAVGLLCLYDISIPIMKRRKPADGGSFYKDYLSIEKCNSVKGIFILIVFISHATKCFTLSGSLLDKSYDLLNNVIIGQSMVSLFLMYSGYGMMLSIDKKGEAYVKGIPTKRFLKVLLHFDIAVVLFGLLQMALGRTFALSEYLLSLTGWLSLGNSNWYIFVVLCLYLIVWLSFTIAKKNKWLGVALCTILSIALVLILHQFKEDKFWYDTIMCFPIGMAYYQCQEIIEKFVFKNNIHWLLSLAVCGVLYAGAFYLRRYWVMFIPRHIFFGLIVIQLTMKIGVNNSILQFFGKHLFAIYILQRLPMIALQHFGLTNHYLFVILSFIITLLLTIPFDWLLGKLDSVLFQPKPIKHQRMEG